MSDWIRPDPRPARTDGREKSPDDDAERSLGRAVAIGLPIASLAGAIAAGYAAGAGSFLLVLASGALLGTVALLWSSLRTLSGDAPLPLALEGRSGHRKPASELSERKRRVLRALKDLEGEHELGKIDDADYEAVSAQYREEAKALMREIDRQGAPARAEAERIAAEFLARRAARLPSVEDADISAPGANGRAAAGEADDAAGSGSKGRPAGRIACPRCAVSNEPDASFCKRCGSTLEKSPAGEASR